MSVGAGRVADLIGDRTNTVRIGTVAADGAAAGTLFIAPCDCTVELDMTVTSNVTGDTTNYATVTLYDGGSTGTGATSMGSFATTYGNNLTANTVKSVTLTSDDLDAGDVARFTVGQTASGAALTNLSFVITWWPI